MDRPVSEHELLSLIEGRLAPEREEAVRAALTGDPALDATVRAMSQDRALSRDLSWSAERAAPAAMAGAALATAERLALLAHAGRAGGWRTRAGAKRWAAASLLLFVGLSVTLVGAGVYWLTRPSDPDIIYTRGIGASGRFEPAPDRRGTGPALPWPGNTSAPQAMRTDVFMAPAEPIAAKPGAGDSAQPPSDTDPSTWAQEAQDKLAAPGDADVEADLGGLPLERAIALARAGRLRAVVPAEDPERWPRGRQLLASSQVRRGATETADPGSPAGGPIRFTVELAAPHDEHGLAMKDALAGLYSRLSALAAGPVRFEELPEHSGDLPTGSTLPSTDPVDVLWWAHPASKWTRAESVLIGVRLEPAR